MRGCTADADCIAAITRCCDCGATADELIGINRAHEDTYRAYLECDPGGGAMHAAVCCGPRETGGPSFESNAWTGHARRASWSVPTPLTASLDMLASFRAPGPRPAFVPPAA
jgi:hypothetical protein